MAWVRVAVVLAAVVSLQATAGSRCSEPSILHGSVAGGGTGEAYFGRVSCDPGYQLVGGSRLKCRGGRWSPMEPPVCAAPATCSSTPELPRGRAVPVRGSRGAAMRFKCRHGYKLYGPRTTHCTGDSWSHTATPACVRATCEEEGRMSIPYGEARALLGGGVYKYRCNAGLAMAGSDTVFCNGESWNSSVPTCLVPPGQPQLTLPSRVEAGEEVEVSCQATEGNPLPTLAISLQGRVLGEGALGVSVPLRLDHSHHGQEVACEASSSAGTSRTHQTLHVLSAPLTAHVSGPTTLHHGATFSYSCRVEGARPPPRVRWTVRDSRGGERKEEAGEVEGGEVEVLVELEEGVQWVEVECTAENAHGEARGVMRGHAHFLPSSMLVTSDVSAATPSTSVTFSCAALHAFPAPRILWRAELAGARTTVLEEEGEVHTEEQEDGTVSSYAELVVEVGEEEEGVERVRAECRAVGAEELGERRSEWREVAVWPALTAPTMAGLQPGATLSQGDLLPLTCSTPFTHQAQFISWLVDGEIQGEDHHLRRQGDTLTSSWEFLPTPGQEEVECRSNGLATLATRLALTVTAAGQEEEKEEEDAVMWVPVLLRKEEEEEEEMELEEEFAGSDPQRAEERMEMLHSGRRNDEFEVRLGEGRSGRLLGSSATTATSSLALLTLATLLAARH